MLERIASTLQRECLLDRSRPVLVGVSGGPDSLCLLHVLWQLGYPLVVAHLDHGLRPESAAESKNVQQIAGRLGVKFELGKEDVPTFAETNGYSLEEAARILRYRFLFFQARRHGAQAVAVGHTADDQIETVLMHFLRGSGLSGLKGMTYRALPNSWSQETPLVRPLLGTWRSEVMQHITAFDLQPNIDQSNLDVRFYRNRLRHELLPYLETYNPGIRQVLWRTADVLREDHAVLEHMVDAAWQTCIIETGKNYVAFDPERLRGQAPGVQRRLLRRAIGRLRPGLRDIDFETIERAQDFLNTPSRNAQLDLSAGLRLLLEARKLWLGAWEADLPIGDWPQLPPGDALELDVPGSLTIPDHWLLRAKSVALTPEAGAEIVRQQILNNADPFQAWADAAALSFPLHVRPRRPADRFQPLGMQGHSIKLADFMVNVKLPRRARTRWPVVCSGQEIVWLPGFRLAHPFRLTAETQKVVHLQLLRK